MVPAQLTRRPTSASLVPTGETQPSHSPPAVRYKCERPNKPITESRRVLPLRDAADVLHLKGGLQGFGTLGESVPRQARADPTVERGPKAILGRW